MDGATSLPTVSFILMWKQFMKLIPLSPKDLYEFIRPSHQKTYSMESFVPNRAPPVRSCSVDVKSMILISFPRDLRGTKTL